MGKFYIIFSSLCHGGECNDKAISQNEYIYATSFHPFREMASCLAMTGVSELIFQLWLTPSTQAIPKNTAPQQFLKFIDIPADLPHYHTECIKCIDLYKAGSLQYSPNAPPGRWQNIPLYKLNSSLTYYG